MIVITGIGWLTRQEYGCLISKLNKPHEGFGSLYSYFKHKSYFSCPVKNFSRFDAISKMTCFSAALALKDAGISYSVKHKQDIGIYGANKAGCLDSNLNYFQDYISSGRILARGNLFIYTLPSIPLAEASIHFGLSGPLLHMSFHEKRIPCLLSFAGDSITGGETPSILAISAEENDAICFVLKQEADISPGKNVGLQKVISATGNTYTFDEMINAINGIV
ncbi:MAG: hypothetical protein KKD47_07895 [Proteobacteria bacterium]|nr:hypothetical protein [Pseudomonadota bacterium]